MIFVIIRPPIIQNVKKDLVKKVFFILDSIVIPSFLVIIAHVIKIKKASKLKPLNYYKPSAPFNLSGKAYLDAVFN